LKFYTHLDGVNVLFSGINIFRYVPVCMLLSQFEQFCSYLRLSHCIIINIFTRDHP